MNAFLISVAGFPDRLVLSGENSQASMLNEYGSLIIVCMRIDSVTHTWLKESKNGLEN